MISPVLRERLPSGTSHGMESAGSEPPFPTTGLPGQLPNEMSSHHRPAGVLCGRLRALFKTGAFGLLSIWSRWD